MRDWGNELIKAYSLGITQDEFWKMTPFQLYLISEAANEKVKANNVVNLYLLNTVMNMFSSGEAVGINYNDIYGIKQMKDYDLRDRQSFATREEFDQYVIDVVNPIKEELGV